MSRHTFIAKLYIAETYEALLPVTVAFHEEKSLLSSP